MNHDFDKLDEILLDEINKVGLIESSTVDLYKNRKKLTEAVQLNESENTHEEYHTMGETIRWEQFLRVYTDYEHYPKFEDILSAIGLPLSKFNKKDSARSKLSQVRRYFVEVRPDGYKVDVPLDRRKEKYYLNRNEIPHADERGVNPGKRGRVTNTTKVVNVLNGKDVVPGEFYTDISRIPKRKWGSWVKFWERQVSRIKNKTSILGKVWRKVFIMGYQFSRGVVVEIWYNSATSDFSVYDQNGAELGRPASSLQEAVRLFVTFLLKEYGSDQTVFSGNMNDLAKSYHSAITRGVNRDAIEAEREAKLASIEAKSDSDPLHSVGAVKRMSSEKNKQRHEDADAKRARMADGAKKKWNKFSDAMKKGAASYDNSTDDEKRQQQRDDFNQKKRKEYEQRTGQTYDHDDVIYSGQDDKPKSSSVPGLPDLRYKDIKNKAPADMSEDQLNAIWRSYREAQEKARRSYRIYQDIKAKYEEDKNNPGEQDLVTVSDVAEKRKKAEEDIKNARKIPKNLIKVDRKALGESHLFETQEELDDIISNLDWNPQSQEMDREAVSRRKMAAQSGFTTTAIKTASYEEMLSMYHETRVNPSEANVFGRFLLNTLSMFRGRKDKIRLPTHKANAFDRLRMAIIGAMYRADFVIGFSLKDAINVEIWYVTEPDPSKGRLDSTTSSFYVYDVTAKKVIRSNLPYYRNALGVAFAKLTINDQDVEFETDKKKKSQEELNYWASFNRSRERN